MVNFLRNTVELAGLAGVFAVFAARPFMPHLLGALAPVFAILVLGATYLLLLSVNFLGCYLAGGRLTPVEREALRHVIRQGNRNDLPSALLTLLNAAGIALLMVFLVNELGWSKVSALATGAAISAVMALLFTAFQRRHDQG